MIANRRVWGPMISRAVTNRNNLKHIKNVTQRASTIQLPAVSRATHEPAHNIISRSLMGVSRSGDFPQIIRTPALQHTLGLCIVPQAEKWVVERFGKFNRILDSGINFTIPFVEKIKYIHSTKEAAFEIANQTAITQDNVTITIDGVLYLKIFDPILASYQIENPVFAISNLAQTTMRSEIGKISLDKTFAERDKLNENIVRAISEAAHSWGIECKRYEIRDINVPPAVKKAMELQAEAERNKRKTVLESEAEKISQANIAEGRKQATILNSEALFTEQVNFARGEAEAIRLKAMATAEGIERLIEAVSKPGGQQAVALRLAEQYVAAFAKIAQKGNTIVVPANVNDSSAMVAQALAMFDNIFNKNKGDTAGISREEALTKLANELGIDASNIQQDPRAMQQLQSKLASTLSDGATESQQRAATNQPDLSIHQSSSSSSVLPEGPTKSKY